jgi:hypothetical protein
MTTVETVEVTFNSFESKDESGNSAALSPELNCSPNFGLSRTWLLKATSAGIAGFVYG